MSVQIWQPHVITTACYHNVALLQDARPTEHVSSFSRSNMPLPLDSLAMRASRAAAQQRSSRSAG